MTNMLRHKDGNGKIIETTYEKFKDDAEWNVLKTQNFLTPAEIVEDLFTVWSDQSKAEFLAVGFDNLITLHHGFGTAVRNTYGLWNPNYPGVIPGDLGDGHPDGISMNIIEALYRRIEGANNAYNRAMSVVEQKALDRAFDWEKS